ncbi:UNVERIFIED_CONTAM: hypothetical protein HDU68_009694 [Siphonaria sp. JEL0065]|nr:hypothetical protein HDU68_009694 [Siphonaria sp. JEL0065]
MSANFTDLVVLTGSANTAGLVLAFSTYVLFGAAALAYTYYSKARSLNVNTDFFITARNSANLFKITWSWTAAAMGSWILYTCAFQAPGVNYGINGLVINAIVTGLPLPLVAHMGDYVRKHVPKASSVTGYAKWRFGRVIQVLMMLQILQSLIMGVITEYTTIGGIFLTFFGIQPYIPIIVCGSIVMAYTAAGGFFISIITDVWQAILALVMLVVSVIYLGASFKGFDFPPMDDYLGVTITGWQAIATLGIPYMCLTLFSEGFWQRVWAAENPRVGKIGAWIACGLITIITFALGFGGTLAYWSGRASETSNPNLSFFLAFSDGSGTGSVFITILVIMFAVAINESAVDTAMNAMTDVITNIATVFGIDLSLNIVRAIVLVVQIPIVIVASYLASNGTNILQIFLFNNQLSTSLFVPIAAGLIPSLNRVISTFSVVMAIVTSIASVLGLGVSMYGSLYDGFIAFFWSATYAWQPFVLAPCVALVALVFWCCIDLGVRKLMGWDMPNLPFDSLEAEKNRVELQDQAKELEGEGFKTASN